MGTIGSVVRLAVVLMVQGRAVAYVGGERLENAGEVVNARGSGPSSRLNVAVGRVIAVRNRES
ncbi:hypothetical protein GCM10027174_40520 [Salinifilum aidingensis]